MKKLNKEKLEELIKFESESNYIDFKAKQYSKEQNEELLKDIMSMVNSDAEGYKYIIIGVKCIPGQDNEVKGIDENIKDDSEYQQLVENNIEPNINFSYISDEIEGKKIAYFYIDDNNIDKPYMVKKDNNKLKKGDAFKRIGSSQRKLLRRDYDEIYKDNKKELLILQKIKSNKNEILLIQQLNCENDYLIQKNREIKNTIELYKESIQFHNKSFIRHKLPSSMSLEQWKYKTLTEIKSFNVKKLDDELINRLFETIDTKYSKEYLKIISSIRSDYQYLTKLENIFSELSISDGYENKYKNNLIINSLIMREVFDNFNGEYSHFLIKCDFRKRIEELTVETNKLEE
ncbi:helix-turn-helix domain-containing protein [Clostridium butyricum]|uniref:AlbA family DNA-binding domain-containing protein n=1 Tax=Clostridium butyricum TaxID=1492 RepID=UPI001F585CA7|nr:ATP-binding protein [Clostridium butyricum]